MIPSSGYNKRDIGVHDAMLRLKYHINDLPGVFRNFSAEELLRKSAVDKWSKQEILGHLIDSAINNLKRFTDIQFSPQPYQVMSYKQNELVIANNYQALPLDHLLQLWQSLNRQIIYIVKYIPEEKMDFKVDPQYHPKEIKTLSWIIADYVAHLEHHLKQVFPDP